MLLSILLAAFVLDAVFGEPRRGHPLAGFGHMTELAEILCRRRSLSARWQGVCAVALLLLPLLGIGVLLRLLPNTVFFIVGSVIVYFCIALQSLGDHATAVYCPLQKNDLPAARNAVACIVSRDCAQLDATQVASACCESVLENGSDGVFAAVFWFVVAGVPGVLVYRGANTLDAMWGYRNERYREFGWAAAKLDDILNYIPARLVAVSYVLMGDTVRALRCWRTQASGMDSPNGGPVMAAGAGALGVSLGGEASYHGQLKWRPVIGEGPAASAESIVQAVSLVRRVAILWLVTLVFLGQIFNA